MYLRWNEPSFWPTWIAHTEAVAKGASLNLFTSYIGLLNFIHLLIYLGIEGEVALITIDEVQE